jgi:hypothetical protein
MVIEYERYSGAPLSFSCSLSVSMRGTALRRHILLVTLSYRYTCPLKEDNVDYLTQFVSSGGHRIRTRVLLLRRLQGTSV